MPKVTANGIGIYSKEHGSKQPHTEYLLTRARLAKEPAGLPPTK